MKKTIINVLIGLTLVFLLVLFQKMNHRLKTNKWPSVEGVVVYSLIKKEFGNIKIHYKPFIKYRYTVGDKTFENIYYKTTSSGFLNEESALKIINQFPEGEIITVHYNPKNPEDSILSDLQ